MPGCRDPARRPRPPPVLRGAGAAVRRARRRRDRDRLLRADRGRRARGDDFEYMPHVGADDVGRASPPTSPPAVGALRAPTGERPGRARCFTIGFCMGGRLAFLTRRRWASGSRRDRLLRLARRPVAQRHAGAGRHRGPRSRQRARHLRRRGPGHPGRRSVAEFEHALTAAGVDHRLITYPGAPHSFFDRKATEFADGERRRLGRGPRVRRVARTGAASAAVDAEPRPSGLER